MSARAWPLATLILGLVTLGLFIALGAQPAVTEIYERTQVATAVSAFQRAETPADIAVVFGTPPDARVIAAQNAINTLDLYGFTPAYALFLAAAAIMLGGLRNRWAQVAIVFGLIGALADVVETWKQLQLTADLANVEAHLPIAPWHWLKYAALALNGVAIASLCISAEKKRWIIAVLALLPFPLVAGAYAELWSPRPFAGAFAAYWIGLLVLGAIETVRAKGSRA
jgi:hypothetical protein